MALLALDTEATSVNVLARVAGTTDHRWLDDVLWPDMAFGATCFCVATRQRKPRMSRMVEVPHLPAVRRVTLTAILSEPSVVDVILCMAPDTFLGRLIESLRGVTLAATNDDVQSGEGIFGLVMVEVDFRPFRRCVALLALLAECAAMWLSRAMAVDASGTQLLIFRHRSVAGVAIEPGVRPLEREFEACQVVEIGHPPELIAVTVTTGRSESADMLIVRFVAARAILGYGILEIAAAVTIATADPGVLAQKRKPGLAGMIEFLGCPVRG